METICVDRYLGISSPMHARGEWRESRVRYLMMIVVVGSLIADRFSSLRVQVRLCYHVQRNAHLWKTCPDRPVRVVTILKTLQIILVVILPLIGILYSSHREADIKTSTDDPNDEFLRDTDSRQKRDRKVTITVLAIIACFFLTHTPSTLPFILELISPIMTPSQRDYIRRLMPELGP
ncbi:hypothetical protein COOONC_20054, partial [Cooperia oncophora]